MICTLCVGITHSVAKLDRVAEDTLHCSLCDKDVESVLDDSVEVSFAYQAPGAVLDLHRDFATYQHFYTSSSYPYREDWRRYHERFTVAAVTVPAGESAKLPLALAADKAYRLICLDTHADADLVPSETGAAAAELALKPGDAAVTHTNRTEQPVWCRALELDYPSIVAITG